MHISRNICAFLIIAVTSFTILANSLAENRTYECSSVIEMAFLNISSKHSVVTHANNREKICTFSVDGATKSVNKSVMNGAASSMRNLNILKDIFWKNRLNKDKLLFASSLNKFEENSIFLFGSAGPFDDGGIVSKEFVEIFSKNSRLVRKCIGGFYSGLSPAVTAEDNSAYCVVTGEAKNMLVTGIRGKYFRNVLYTGR